MAEGQRTYQSLYRKWRPQKFSEVVDQVYTVRTLQNAIIQGEIAHAYLFAGPRGTGKTSVARILAKAVNCPERAEGESEPCSRCESCQRIARGSALDVIEIDGASNRGIDQIRQLREEVKFAPTQSRYKVYIIDEVHMLTNEAFNALLKTLEEPPGHVIFVFATTEPHKVLPTVLSRCQAFEFKNIPREQIEAQLREVAHAEGIEIEGEALNAIARHARGALRNALVLLEQLVSYKGKTTVIADDLSDVLGLPPEETLDAFLKALIEHDGPQALQIISQLAERGRDFELFMEELLHRSRDHLIQALNGSADTPTEDWVRLTGELLEIKREMTFAFEKRMFLEVRVLKLVRPPSAAIGAEAAPASDRQEIEPQDQAAETPSGRSLQADSGPQQPAPKKGKPKRSKQRAPEAPQEGAKARETAADPQGECWTQLLERVKQERIAVHALLAEAELHMREGTLVIEYPLEFGFHKERLEQPENFQYLRAAVGEIYGELPLKVAFSQEPAAEDAPRSPSAPTGGALREKAELVREIFGGEIER